MNLKHPSAYARRILVSVTGMSPAVLTETLYALAHQARPFLPTELIVLTTQEGKRGLTADLMNRENGKFEQFYRDYPHLGPSRPATVTVEAVKGADGQELKDIMSAEDNLRFADLATEVIRRLAADSDSAIHVSLAGGRKTMGFFIGYALSLFGRLQDRLSHVIVPNDFEGNPAFYYPTPQSSIIRRKSGDGWLDARDAVVSLSEIPFVALSALVKLPIHENKDVSYQEVVQMINAQALNQQVWFDLDQRTVTVCGTPVDLSDAQYDRYAWLCWRRLQGQPHINFKNARGVEVRRQDAALEYAEFWNRAFQPSEDLKIRDKDGTFCAIGIQFEGQAITQKEGTGMESGFLPSASSGVMTALTRALGEPTADRFRITNFPDSRDAKGKRKGSYGVRVAAEDIVFVNGLERLAGLAPVPEFSVEA